MVIILVIAQPVDTVFRHSLIETAPLGGVKALIDHSGEETQELQGIAPHRRKALDLGRSQYLHLRCAICRDEFRCGRNLYLLTLIANFESYRQVEPVGRVDFDTRPLVCLEPKSGNFKGVGFRWNWVEAVEAAILRDSTEFGPDGLVS